MRTPLHEWRDRPGAIEAVEEQAEQRGRQRGLVAAKKLYESGVEDAVMEWADVSMPTNLGAGTTGSNFTSYAGVGVRVLRAGRHGLIASYRLHHISNG
ncbi:MAG TPA: hypothetical protein PLX85_09745, partial [Dehalococcoidia bacterium]|nr:hypothetical protein [Dehalococcoidia bacterium]